MLHEYVMCPDCYGKGTVGRIFKTPCAYCKGTGKVSRAVLQERPKEEEKRDDEDLPIIPIVVPYDFTEKSEPEPEPVEGHGGEFSGGGASGDYDSPSSEPSESESSESSDSFDSGSSDSGGDSGGGD